MERQPSHPSSVSFPDRTNLWVDEDRRVDPGLVVRFWDPVCEEAEALGHLGCRETDTRFLDHGTYQIATEVSQTGAPEPILGHRLGDRSQDRVAESDDLEETGLVRHVLSRNPSNHPSCSRWWEQGHWGCRP